LAIERQRDDCEKIAADRGWRVVETYIDNSVSASSKSRRRPAYERMVADHRNGRFSALVCWDLDRLTRQPRQLEDWIDAAEEKGLILVTANGEADLSTDGGRLFARIKASVARAEVERKSARQRRAAQQRADHGMTPSGVRLTGYSVNGEINPAEADLVRTMFDRLRGRRLTARDRRVARRQPDPTPTLQGMESVDRAHRARQPTVCGSRCLLRADHWQGRSVGGNRGRADVRPRAANPHRSAPRH
jgi:DNA invertase Pin-like site-specific DNA recombinase